MKVDHRRHYSRMKTSVKLLLFSALAGISLSSCIVASGPPGAVVETGPVGVGIYPTLPVGYVGDAYFYGGRYYYGGRYEPGSYYWHGRHYDHRYYHGGRYYYGGRHRHY